jgi:hypothetical protein
MDYNSAQLNIKIRPIAGNAPGLLISIEDYVTQSLHYSFASQHYLHTAAYESGRNIHFQGYTHHEIQ